MQKIILSEIQEFAQIAHQGQVRKYIGTPYVTHPIAVSRLVRRFGGDTAMQAAALLHDTVEDTDTTLQTISVFFGADVAALVEQLTDVSRPEDGNRRVRKAIDLEHTSRASARAKSIKLADLWHNTASIALYGGEFAFVYLEEKARLLQVLTDASIPALHVLATRAYARSMDRLTTIFPI